MASLLGMTKEAGLGRRRLGRTDIELPTLGVGCSGFGDRARQMPATVGEETVEAALALGADYFDTAPYYGFGLSERRLGDALRKRNGVRRLISTKVGRLLVPDPSLDPSFPRNGFHSAMPFRPVFDYSYDGVMRSWEASLHRLGLAAVDILLVHDIGAFAHGDDHPRHLADLLDGGMRALRELKASGAARAFGLGVNEVAVCDEILDEAEFDCILIAGRYTLLDQSCLALFARCAERGVGVISAGPYNSGILAGGSRRQGPIRYDYGEAPAEIIDRVRRIETICDRHGVPIGAAALQFPLAHPAISCVLPGIASAARMEETVALAGYPIPEPFWHDLRAAGLLSADAPTR